MLSKSDIRPSQTYTVEGKSFANEYSAYRYLVEQNLIEFFARNGWPGFPSLDPYNRPQSEPVPPSRISLAEHGTDDLRRWIHEHVHELLPVLQAIAEANPKAQSVDV